MRVINVNKDNVGDLILNYLKTNGDSSYSDFQKYAFKHGFTAGQVSGKTRTLLSNGEIIKRERGIYGLTENLDYKNELLKDIKKLLDKYNLSPAAINETDMDEYYKLYSGLQKIYVERSDNK